MASTSSLEASEIRRRGRRRLLGAVTLVLLLVVFVPMVLDSEPRPQRAVPSVTIPPKEEAPPLPPPTPAAPPPPAPQSVAPPKLEGFAVQVGAFRDEDRLRQVRDKLQAAGVVHYTERIDASGGAMTRLRAGPFPTREAAEQARAKLQGASLDGKVVSLP